MAVGSTEPLEIARSGVYGGARQSFDFVRDEHLRLARLVLLRLESTALLQNLIGYKCIPVTDLLEPFFVSVETLV